MTDSGSTVLRLVVMGTGPFAVPMFRALINSRHDVMAVCTRPDRVARGRRPPPNPMRKAADELQIPVIEPPDVNAADAHSELAAMHPDLLVVCDYGQILSPATLTTARYGGINLHGSLLPRHRGAAPVQWAILEGDSTTGVSVIRMSPKLDAGAVITSCRHPILPDDTSAALEERLAASGGDAVLSAIEQIIAADGSEVGTPQEASQITRAPRLTKACGMVDWSDSADRLERKRRAMEPWPRLATFYVDEKQRPLRLVLADVAVGTATPEGMHPGTVIYVDRGEPGEIRVVCGGGTTLIVRQLVPEGRRLMTAGAFLRGSSLREGCQLG
jgi:methionyl-tRNA formyltransferase